MPKKYTPKQRAKNYKIRKPKMVRVMVTLPQELLDMADQAAEKDFTTRSDLFRAALRWYLRPEGRDSQSNAEEVYKTVKYRKDMAGMRELTKDIPRYAQE